MAMVSQCYSLLPCPFEKTIEEYHVVLMYSKKYDSLVRLSHNTTTIVCDGKKSNNQLLSLRDILNNNNNISITNNNNKTNNIRHGVTNTNARVTQY